MLRNTALCARCGVLSCGCAQHDTAHRHTSIGHRSSRLRSRIAHTSQRTPRLHRWSGRNNSDCVRPRSARGSGRTERCHATSMLRSRPHEPCCVRAQSDRQNDGREARRRRLPHAPRRSAVPRDHSREPRLLIAPAARRCRALPPAHCPRGTTLVARNLHQANSPTPRPLPLAPGSCKTHSQRGFARLYGIQGTRAGDRGCTADGRLGEALRRPAVMYDMFTTLVSNCVLMATAARTMAAATAAMATETCTYQRTHHASSVSSGRGYGRMGSGVQ